MKRMIGRIRPFARSDEGSVVVEAVIILPFLSWAVLALFVYWDAYRSINTVQKASYTIADTISREKNPISGSYLAGLHGLMDYLANSPTTSRMRMTSLTWDDLNQQYRVLWSCSPGSGMAVQTDATLATYAGSLPKMADADTVVLLETEVDYAPAFDVGLSDQTIEQFIVTRPRNAPSVVLTSCAA